MANEYECENCGKFYLEEDMMVDETGDVMLCVSCVANLKVRELIFNE